MLELNLKHVTATSIEVTLGDGQKSHSFDLLPLVIDSGEKVRQFQEDPSTYGVRIQAALFPSGSPAAQALKDLLIPGQITLITHDRPLDSIPWEYAHDGRSLLAAQHAFLRSLPASERPPIQPFPLVERLPLYFLPANPLLAGDEPLIPLDTETAWDLLEQCVRDHPAAIDLVKLIPPTADSLQKALLAPRPCLVHYFGHGNVDLRSGSAELLFESDTSRMDPLPAAGFVDRVRGKAVLVFLGACLSAMGGAGESANLARLLVRSGIPFVVGMQFIVMVRTAERVTDFFYHALLAGNPPPEAMRQARLMLQEKDLFQAGIPVLYAASPQAQIPSVPSGTPQVLLPPPYSANRIQVNRLPVPEAGFLGRQRELVEIGERLKASHPPFTLTLHGIGGTGKTALLRAAIQRHAWRFPDGVLAIPLEPLPELSAVVALLEQFAGLPDGSSLDPASRSSRLLDQLDGQRILLALDNFESLDHARDGSDETGAILARDLHHFFSQLPARGVALLVSSREPTGLPGEQVQEILGLQDHFGGLLFLALLSNRREDISFAQAKTISGAVHGHPLALRLLAPVFENDRSLSPDNFYAQLDRILPSAADAWAKTDDRQGGLRACFEYSHRALPETLRTCLARLSLFHGSFPAWLAAPVLLGEAFDFEKQQEAFQEAAGSLHALWSRGMLEDSPLMLRDGSEPAQISPYHFYSLHPAISPFAGESLSPADRPAAESGFFLAMRTLGSRAYPHTQEEQWVGMDSDMLLAETAHRALLDLIAASRMKQDAAASILCFHTAFIQQRFGDLDGAMERYKESLEIDERLGDLKGKSTTLHEIAGIFVTRGDLDGAMERYQESLEIEERLGDLKGKSTTLHEIAGIFVTRGDLDGAMERYKESLEIDERLGDLKGKSATLNQMARIFVTRGDLDGAMERYQQSLEIEERLGDLQGKSATLHEIAGIFVTRGDLDGAMERYHQALEIQEHLGNLKGKSATLHAMANVFVTRGDLDGAMERYHQALEIQEHLGNLQGKSATLNQMAGIFVTRGDLDGAMERYKESLEIKERLGDLKGKSTTLHEIAGIFVTRGDLDGAMERYQQALEIDERLGDLQGKAATLAQMAGIFVTRGDLDGAMERYQQAHEILERLGDLKGKSATLHQMANVFVTRGDLDGAMERYQQALEIDERLGDLQGKAATQAMLAQVQIVKGENEAALRNLLDARQTLSGMGAAPDVRKVAGIIASWRAESGAEKFDPFWQQVTGGQPLPSWLLEGGEEKQGMTLEQFVHAAISAALEKKPEAAQFFDATQKMSADANAPQEVRALMIVLHAILSRNLHPDLSSLPEELASLVRKELGEA